MNATNLIPHHHHEPPPLSAEEVSTLLSRLCTGLGFCLPPQAAARLCQSPPISSEAFTDAVFTAEGLPADNADRHLYRQVRAMVEDTFQQR